MPRVLVNVMSSEWSDHFIGPDGQTRIGLWLLFDSHDEVRCLLRIRPGIQFVDSSFRIAGRLGATALPDPAAFAGSNPWVGHDQPERSLRVREPVM
jgi:hypothetical protein